MLSLRRLSETHGPPSLGTARSVPAGEGHVYAPKSVSAWRSMLGSGSVTLVLLVTLLWAMRVGVPAWDVVVLGGLVAARLGLLAMGAQSIVRVKTTQQWIESSRCFGWRRRLGWDEIACVGFETDDVTRDLALVLVPHGEQKPLRIGRDTCELTDLAREVWQRAAQADVLARGEPAR